jgi:hypothetical protein
MLTKILGWRSAESMAEGLGENGAAGETGIRTKEWGCLGKTVAVDLHKDW